MPATDCVAVGRPVWPTPTWEAIGLGWGEHPTTTRNPKATMSRTTPRAVLASSHHRKRRRPSDTTLTQPPSYRQITRLQGLAAPTSLHEGWDFSLRGPPSHSGPCCVPPTGQTRRGRPTGWQRCGAPRGRASRTNGPTPGATSDAASTCPAWAGPARRGSAHIGRDLTTGEGSRGGSGRLDPRWDALGERFIRYSIRLMRRRPPHAAHALVSLRGIRRPCSSAPVTGALCLLSTSLREGCGLGPVPLAFSRFGLPVCRA